MGNIVIYIALCIILPILLLSLYLEPKARNIMFSLIFGVIACLLAYYLNNQLQTLMDVTAKYYTTTFGPMVEEILKFFPVLFIVFGLKKNFKETVANAFAVGIGFCVVENFFYLFSDIGTAGVLWIVSRCVSTGLMHGMSAAIIGLGVYFAKKETRMTALFILTSLFSAFIYHGLFNLLVTSENMKIIGALIPTVTFIAIFILVQGDELKKFLWDELADREKPAKNSPTK